MEWFAGTAAQRRRFAGEYKLRRVRGDKCMEESGRGDGSHVNVRYLVGTFLSVIYHDDQRFITLSKGFHAKSKSVNVPMTC